MQVFKEQYLRISGSFPDVTVDFYYLVGTDTAEDPAAIRSAQRVEAKVKSHLSKAVVQYQFVNASKLWDQIQKRPTKDKQLVWAETPMNAKEGYVGLVRMADYYEFLKDDQGLLAERFFESNVRGFQTGSTINTRLRVSTRMPGKANFWLLNNGVTIISPKVGSAGHLRIEIADPQIVNGLQTSREIFDYFVSSEPGDETRSLLVRVIQTRDAEVSDLIIRATNSQNKMSESSLRMTDNVHRKIEELLKQHGLYYDRRKGFHKDQGVAIVKIISATVLAQAVISTLLWRPDDARARPGDYFKDEEKYNSIFPDDDRFPVSVYVSCIKALRRVIAFLESHDVDKSEKRNLRFYVLAVLASNMTEEAVPSPSSIVNKMTEAGMTDLALTLAYKTVKSKYDKMIKQDDPDSIARGADLRASLEKDARKHFAKTRPPIQKKDVIKRLTKSPTRHRKVT